MSYPIPPKTTPRRGPLGPSHYDSGRRWARECFDEGRSPSPYMMMNVNSDVASGFAAEWKRLTKSAPGANNQNNETRTTKR